MRKSKFRKSDIKVLLKEEGPKVIWTFGVPKKGSAEYGIEYLYFQFYFKDRRRHGVRVYIDKGEVGFLEEGIKLAKKYYKKIGEPNINKLK